MPGSWVGRHYPDVGLFEDIARIAERALFDMIFFGGGSSTVRVSQVRLSAGRRRCPGFWEMWTEKNASRQLWIAERPRVRQNFAHDLGKST
jgi:hypothetical protein